MYERGAIELTTICWTSCKTPIIRTKLRLRPLRHRSRHPAGIKVPSPTATTDRHNDPTDIHPDRARRDRLHRLTDAATYRALRAPRQSIRRVRGLDIHVTCWGPEPSAQRPTLVLLHGFLNTGSTFQFMVDAMRQDWSLVAPDWRGFGRSAWAASSYWFPDYLADLDALLDQFSPDSPVCLVGHSMGGNVACLYAGVRPERVRCIVDLEGIGVRRTTPEEAPAQLRRWLDEVKTSPGAKHYASFEQLATVIRFRYPRFTTLQADFLARCWGGLDADGHVHLLGDPRHAWANPILYRRDESEALWRRIEAPVLLMLGAESEFVSRLGEDGTDTAFHAAFPRLEIARVAGAGHMLHIERADLVAELTENFLHSYG